MKIVFSYLLIIIVIFIYPVCGLKISQPPGGLPDHAATLVLLAAALVVTLLNLFAKEELLREHLAALLLIILLLSGLLFLYLTHTHMHSLEPVFTTNSGAADEFSLGTENFNAAAGFRLLVMAGVLLAFPLAGASRKISETMLSRQGRNVSIIVTALAATSIISIAAFSMDTGSAAADFLLVLALGQVMATLFLIAYMDRTGPCVLYSMVFVSLSPLVLFMGLLLSTSRQTGPSPAGSCLPTIYAISACSVAVAFVSAGREIFRRLRSARVCNYAVSSAVAFGLIASLWGSTEIREQKARSLAVTGTLQNERAARMIYPFSTAKESWKLDYCITGKEATNDLDLPIVPEGFCPEAFENDPAALPLTESAGSFLHEVGKKIRPGLTAKTRLLAISVKNPSGRLRVFPVYLPALEKIQSSGACGTMTKIELPWNPPAEETDLPLTFPLCPGAEISARDPLRCLILKVGPAPPSAATGGGGCKSPNHFTAIKLAFMNSGKVNVQLGKGGSPVELPGVEHIESELWKSLTVGKKLGSALVLTLDPENGGTLQDLVNLITTVRRRTVPVVDFVWVQGWEIPM